MKYNLKNFPKNSVNMMSKYPTLVREYDRWFRGFEAELRERLAEEDAIKKRYGPTMIRAFIKEILGDK